MTERELEPAGMPVAAQRFLFATIVVGAGALVASARLVSEVPDALAVAAVMGAIVVGDLPIVHIRHGEQTHTFNWSEASLVAGLVILPEWWLPIIGTAVVAGEYAYKRIAPSKIAFNAMSFAGASFAATAACVAVQRGSTPQILALAAAALVYFAWNAGTVSTIVALSREVSILGVMGSGLQLAFLFAVANSSVAILVAVAAPLEPLVLLVLPPVFVQLVFAYRNTREVIGERDLWVQVQELSVELQRATSAELPDVALDSLLTVVPSTHVELLVLDGDDGEATLHQRHDGETTTTSGSILELVGDIWGRLECDRTSFRVEASTAPPRQRRWLEDHDIAHVLVQPLEWRSDLIGCVRIATPDRRTIDPRLESTLTTVCTQIASALTGQRQTRTLRYQAEHDPVTGMANRTSLIQHLDAMLDRARTPAFAVLFFDLDGFKVVNDSLGHHVGDDVLREVARRLQDQMRPGDVVARFGGDEFVVVCDDVKNAPAAEAIAERLLATLESPATVAGHSVPVSASVGIVCAADSEDPLDAETLLRDADAAMYKAKRIGPGSRSSFTATLRQEVLERLHLENDLRDALQADDLEVHYQPILDLESDSIVELEALARWHHPGRGMVPPNAFIPVAEETGLIRALGVFVLQRACADMRRWLDLDLVEGPLRVAVNLSPLQLDRSLPTVVGEALASHGLPPAALTLEVTESALVADPDAVRCLERLRDLGVHVSLDDFGTGYSSLSALRDLPVDTVKIDQSFVCRLGADERMGALVAGIVDLAHALEMRVVGEGVETSEQARYLGKVECDLVQGWLHGRPMTAADVETRLAADLVAASETGATASERRLRAL